MSISALKMKTFLTIGLLTIVFASIASGQQRFARYAPLTRTQTKEAERRLSEMGYLTGTVNGLFDSATRSALIAFQKWEGRPVTGQLPLDELEAIRNSTAPTAREIGYPHVEVDLDRQVLLILGDEGNVKLLPVSTGTGEPFMDDGQDRVAYRPRG